MVFITKEIFQSSFHIYCMDYDIKKNLIDGLKKEFTGLDPEKENIGHLVAKIDSSTGSMISTLSGTKYSIEDMVKAKKYLQKKIAKHQSPTSERKMYYEISLICIDAIIKEYMEQGKGEK